MEPLYKFCPLGYNNTTNMLYSPMMNEEGNRLTMFWDENHPYQIKNKNLTKELIDFFFAREVESITRFKNYPWAPEIYDIDIKNRTITIEWNGNNTLNHIIYDPECKRSLNNECPTWKQQIKTIIQDIHDAGYYKMALYPHCFFLDKNSNVKTIDFYSCLQIDERYIPFKTLEGMIGPDSKHRFEQALVDDKVDFKIFFEYTLMSHLSKMWPDNPFPEYYKEIYEFRKS